MATMFIPATFFATDSTTDFLRVTTDEERYLVIPEVELLRLLQVARLKTEGEAGRQEVPCLRINEDGEPSECKLIAEWGYDPEEDYEYLHCTLAGSDVFATIC